MSRRKELEVELANRGYRFATETEYDAFLVEFIVQEKEEAVKSSRIKRIVGIRGELGFGLDVFIVPTWFRMIGV